MTASVCAAALIAAGDTAHAADADWLVTAPETITAAQAGVPAGASAPQLARAAIHRSGGPLKLGRHGGLRLVADRRAPTAGNDGSVRQLRFVQTVGGLRVLWSHLSTDVAGDEVRGISGTSVRLPSGRLLGRRALTPAAATRIARRALAGSEHALPAEPVAFAGSPAKPRAPRRAYIVQLRRDRQVDDENPVTVCVVVDATSGKVLDEWEGQAAKALEDKGDQPGRARAAAAQDVLLQAVDARGTNAVVTDHYRDFWSNGSPFSGGGISTTTFGNPGTSALVAAAPTLDITRGHW